MSKLVFTLPTYGDPYFNTLINKSNKKHDLDIYQKIVQGDIQPIDRNAIAIHPTFIEENLRWKQMASLIGRQGVILYCNEDYQNLASNVACINLRSKIPYFGDLCLVVSTSIFDRFGYDIDAFTLIKPPKDFYKQDDDDDDDDDDEELFYWEFYDEEHEAKYKATWAEANYEYNANCGFLYKKRCA